MLHGLHNSYKRRQVVETKNKWIMYVDMHKEIILLIILVT